MDINPFLDLSRWDQQIVTIYVYFIGMESTWRRCERRRETKEEGIVLHINTKVIRNDKDNQE